PGKQPQCIRQPDAGPSLSLRRGRQNRLIAALSGSVAGWRNRQPEEEHASPTRSAPHADTPAVCFDQILNNCQAESSAANGRNDCVRRPIELVEDLCLFRWLDADAMVLDFQLDAAVVDSGTHDDLSTIGRLLDGV